MTLQGVAQKAKGFFWGGDEPLSFEQMQRQRALAALMAQRVAGARPTNVGEGFSAITGALASRRMGARADKAATEGREKASSALGALFQSSLGAAPAPSSAAMQFAPQQAPQTPQFSNDGSIQRPDLRQGIIETAQAIGADPLDLATAISYETAGTFDPMKKGPTTQWGQHMGLIQFGGPQREQYGVDLSSEDAALASQLGANGAIAKYFKSSGFKPGMSGLDLYSTINAGAPGKYSASDANNGGAPGDVRDKWTRQMGAHRAKAAALLGIEEGQPSAMAFSGASQPDVSFVSQMGQPAGIDPRVFAAMSDPYVSELPQMQQSALGALFERQLSRAYPEQMTPYQQAQLEMAQQDQAMQAAKFGIEMQQATQPQPVQWDTREVNGGVVQVNPMTGETRQVVAPVPKGPDFRPATAEEAAQYGAQAGQFGPDGRFYPNDPPSGLAVETGPDGQVRVVQGVGAQGAAGKPFTEAQTKDNAYATRAEGALATLEPIAGALPDRGAILADKVPLGLARGAQSDQYQVARAAADEFLQAVLRKDTGAAITAQEQELYGKTYLPQPGDSEAAMAQKQQARRRAVEALKSGMSPAQILAQEKALQASGSQSLPPVTAAQPGGVSDDDLLRKYGG